MFLDQAKGRIKSDLSKAAVGQLVLAEGELWVTESSAMQKLYGGSFRKVAIQKAEQNAKAAKTAFDRSAAELELDIIATSPPQVQFHLHAQQGVVWSTLQASGLLTPPEELASKHGVVIEGTWHVLGIKDAEPEPARPLNDNKGELLAGKFPGRVYLSDMFHTAELRRRMFGRPFDAYGVIPLLIFRPVA